MKTDKVIEITNQVRAGQVRTSLVTRMVPCLYMRLCQQLYMLQKYISNNIMLINFL